MAENFDYEQLKLDYAQNKLNAQNNVQSIVSDAQYIATLEELCDALISSLDPQDSKVKLISEILNLDNSDMKGQAKKFAMESVLQ